MAEDEIREEKKEENISLDAPDDINFDVATEETEAETNIEEDNSAKENNEEEDRKEEKKKRKNILKSFWNIIKSMFMGRILPVDFIFKHWKTILTIIFLGLFYTSNRYVCQQGAAHIKRVEAEIIEIRYKSLGMFTRLKTLQREDSIAKLIKQNDLKLEIPKHPPYTINATKDNGEE